MSMSWATYLFNGFFQYFALGTVPDRGCRKHINEMYEHILQKDVWALRMFDSMDKIPVGLLSGNLMQYGNMQECLEVKVQENFGSFTGKHCVVEFSIPSIFLQDPNSGPYIIYKWGICIPSTCSYYDVETFLRSGFFLPVNVYEDGCHTLDEVRPFQPGEVFMISLMTILALLACLSTLYDYWSSEKKNRLLLSFSVRTNMRELLNTNMPSSSLDFLTGMRFISSLAVVLGHTYFAGMAHGIHMNRIVLLEWLNSWSHVWLTSRAIAVDTFFVFGGMLCSYQLVKQQAKGEKLNIKLYYIHRYLRITPMLIFMMLFIGTLANRLGTGPIWQSYYRQVAHDCATNWWQNMLFINNWWGNEICMEQTWYLAVDMQLYCLAPLLLIMLQNRPQFGLILTYVTLFVFCLICFLVSFILEEKVDMFRNAAQLQERILYEATFYRAIPWLSGFLLGYYMGKYRHLAFSKMPKVQNSEEKPVNWCKLFGGIFVWILVFGMMLGIMIAVHPFMQPNYQYRAFESAVYLTFSHVIWSICIVLAIAACATGLGGPFSLFLSWKLFVPLSKLSYCIFMFHILMVKLRIADAKVITFMYDYNLLMATVSATAFSIAGSVVLYLLIERPIAILEDIFLYGNREKKSTKELQLLTGKRKILPYGRKPSVKTSHKQKLPTYIKFKMSRLFKQPDV